MLDVTPLRQMTAEVLKSPAYLYEPPAAIRWRSEPSRGSPFGMGSRRFLGQNPPRGAQLFYSLTKKADKLSLKVLDIGGKTIKELPAKATAPGLHRMVWDLTGTTPIPISSEGEGGGPPRLRRRPPGQPPSRPVAAGTYRIVLTVDGKEWTQNIRVQPDPTVPTAVIAPEEGESEDDMDKDG